MNRSDFLKQALSSGAGIYCVQHVNAIRSLCQPKVLNNHSNK
jgi:hypothetical protein